MATLIVGGIGAAIGSFFGPIGALKGFQIGATIGGMIDAANRPGVHQEVGRLADLRVGGSSYGTVIPQVWGATKVPGIVVWSTDLQEHTTTHSVGGKGLGGGGSSTTYSYTASFACYIARKGRNIVVNRIWADDLIIWDRAAPNSNINWRFYDGSETQARDTLIASLLPKTPAYRGTSYVVFQDLQLTNFSNRIPNISFEISTDAVTVGNIMSDIATQTPLVAGDLDLTQATTTVPGYQVNSRSAAKDCMAQLLTYYLYDNVEVDGVLRLLPRGGSPAAQIAADEIGAVLEAGSGTSGSGAIPGVATIRAQEIELPQVVEIVYFSASKYFEQMTQRAIKQVSKSPNIVTLATSLTLSDDDAKRAASTHLYNTWLERTSHIYSALPKYRYLTTGDVLQLPVGDAQTLTRMRISSVQLGLPGEVRLTCLADSAGPLTQFGSGAGTTSVNSAPATFGVIVPSDFYAFSTKELRDADQIAPGFYVGATGAAGWKGGEVWYSTDGGTTYVDGGRISSASVIGTCTSTLATYAGGSAEDTTSTLGVTLIDGGSLASTSDVAAAAGTNAAVVGNEIVTFATATLTGPGAYTLSRFYRGLRGSTPGSHGSAERFILAGAGLVRVNLPAALAGTTVRVKVLSAFQTLSDVTAQVITIAARTPTATEAAVSTLQTTVAGLVAAPAASSPFWRVKGYINAGRGTSDHIDRTYFDGGSHMPSGVTQYDWTEYASGPGGSIIQMGALDWAKWYRIGLHNGGASTVTVHYKVPFLDNFLGINWAGTSLFSKVTGDGSLSNNSGSFTIAAGVSGILSVFFFNVAGGSIDDGSNPFALILLLDALEQAGMTFYDATASASTLPTTITETAAPISNQNGTYTKQSGLDVNGYEWYLNTNGSGYGLVARNTTTPATGWYNGLVNTSTGALVSSPDGATTNGDPYTFAYTGWNFGTYS